MYVLTYFVFDPIVRVVEGVKPREIEAVSGEKIKHTNCSNGSTLVMENGLHCIKEDDGTTTETFKCILGSGYPPDKTPGEFMEDDDGTYMCRVEPK